MQLDAIFSVETKDPDIAVQPTLDPFLEKVKVVEESQESRRSNLMAVISSIPELSDLGSGRRFVSKL
jgi:hypothetical protein